MVRARDNHASTMTAVSTMMTIELTRLKTNRSRGISPSSSAWSMNAKSESASTVTVVAITSRRLPHRPTASTTRMYKYEALNPEGSDRSVQKIARVNRRKQGAQNAVASLGDGGA